MKKSELFAAMENIFPGSTEDVKDTNLNMSVLLVAAYAFIHEKKGDSVSVIKKFLLSVEKDGFFTFDLE